MSHPNEPQDEALASLGRRLGAAEAAQAEKASPEARWAMAQGYRLAGEVVGGVLGGVGFGWLVDHFAHTAPWGMIGGLVLGVGLSIFTAVNAVARANKNLPAMQEAYSRRAAEDDED
jgi:ATP synthase protein I